MKAKSGAARKKPKATAKPRRKGAAGSKSRKPQRKTSTSRKPRQSAPGKKAGAPQRRTRKSPRRAASAESPLRGLTARATHEIIVPVPPGGGILHPMRVSVGGE